MGGGAGGGDGGSLPLRMNVVFVLADICGRKLACTWLPAPQPQHKCALCARAEVWRKLGRKTGMSGWEAQKSSAIVHMPGLHLVAEGYHCL